MREMVHALRELGGPEGRQEGAGASRAQARPGRGPDPGPEGLAGRFCSLAAVAKGAGGAGVWHPPRLPRSSWVTW